MYLNVNLQCYDDNRQALNHSDLPSACSAIQINVVIFLLTEIRVYTCTMQKTMQTASIWWCESVFFKPTHVCSRLMCVMLCGTFLQANFPKNSSAQPLICRYTVLLLFGPQNIERLMIYQIIHEEVSPNQHIKLLV